MTKERAISLLKRYRQEYRLEGLPEYRRYSFENWTMSKFANQSYIDHITGYVIDLIQRSSDSTEPWVVIDDFIIWLDGIRLKNAHNAITEKTVGNSIRIADDLIQYLCEKEEGINASNRLA